MTFSLPKLIADTSTTSIRAVIQSAIVLVGVLVTQTIGLILVAVLTIGEGRTWIEILLVVLSVLVLVSVELVAAYFCYVTTMNKIAASAYAAGQEIVVGITQAAEEQLQKKGIKNPKDYKTVGQIVNVAEYIHKQYQGFPVLVRYALEFFMSRVPAGALVTQVLNAGGEESESDSAVDAVLEEYVLTHDTFGWLLWFFPVSTIVQIVLIILQWQI